MKLPPFLPLVAFHAVARHGSFTAAAQELGVTQSAVSHQIRRLEEDFGTKLFRRLNPGLEVTNAGRALLGEIEPALQVLSGLRRQVRRAASRPRLRIGVGAALLNRWLLRRLPGLLAEQPDLDYELVSIDGNAQSRVDDLDLRIVWVPISEARDSSLQRQLIREQVFPVCRPDLLAGRRLPLPPRQLLTLPLLHKGKADAQGAEWNWSSWRERYGAPPPGGNRGSLRFDSIAAALAAAGEGLGVALGRSLLVRDALADGTLVQPLAEQETMPSSKVQVVQWQASLGGDRRVAVFVAWLLRESQAPPLARPVRKVGRSA